MKKLSDFAGKIVREHFDPIIGPDQNSYMIARFQSAEAIHEQIVSGGYRYYIVQADGCWAGFIAFYPRGERMYLSKFYLDREFRGRGIAGKMFAFIREETAKKACQRFSSMSTGSMQTSSRSIIILAFTASEWKRMILETVCDG